MTKKYGQEEKKNEEQIKKNVKKQELNKNVEEQKKNDGSGVVGIVDVTTRTQGHVTDTKIMRRYKITNSKSKL